MLEWLCLRVPAVLSHWWRAFGGKLGLPVNKLGAWVNCTSWLRRPERVRGAKGHTVRWWPGWTPSLPLYWEGPLGILGNAFALRCLTKISSSDFPSGFPSWAEQGTEQFLLVVEAFPESSWQRGCC